MPKRKPWVPSPQQRLLLQAALAAGPRADEAWLVWRAGVDMDDLDLGSYCLMPLLYGALRDRGIADQVGTNGKSVHRQTWYGNQLLFHAMSRVLRILQDAGIQTLILKGAPLAVLYYRDPGLRPMDDFDVLIRPHQVPAAMERLKGLGFTPFWEPDYGFHEVHLRDRDDRQLDLHWSLLPEIGAVDRAEVEEEFWAGSMPLDFAGARTRTLNPADLLLHVCVHAAVWEPVPAVRWVADAAAIIRTPPVPLNWGRFLWQAERCGLTLTAREALATLRDILDVPIPPVVTWRMRSTPLTLGERIAHNARATEPKLWGLWIAAGVRYLEYQHDMPPGLSVCGRCLGFLQYLRRCWGTHRWWHLAFVAVFRGTRRLVWGITGRVSTPGRFSPSSPRPHADDEREQGAASGPPARVE